MKMKLKLPARNSPRLNRLHLYQVVAQDVPMEHKPYDSNYPQFVPMERDIVTCSALMSYLHQINSHRYLLSDLNPGADCFFITVSGMLL
jgi:hypothetical protein